MFSQNLVVLVGNLVVNPQTKNPNAALPPPQVTR
jgi:hypothetical protein